MMWLMAVMLAAVQAPADAPPQAEPSRQAVDLGVRLAQGGSLATIAPMLAGKDIEDVVKAHPDWTPDDVSFYRKTAARVATAGITRLVRALGHAYAKRLSLADLTQLVIAVESPRAARRRAIEAPALIEALQTVGAIDFKKDTLAAFCAEMGKGCVKK